MQTRLKAIKPDVAIVTYTTNAGRFGHLLEIPHCMSARTNLLFDAIDQEFWADETNRGTTVVPSIANEIVWTVSNHRIALSTPYLMTHGNPYGTDSFPGHEYVRRAMLTLTHGAYPAMTLVWPNNKESGVQAVRELNRRAPWITHKKPEPWAALVLGDYNRQFYGRDPAKVEERYLSNVFGAYRTALEEHLPVSIINEWNLNSEDLKPFRLLVLANTACLSDEQAEAVRGFVRNGGGLVASVDASLLDELGNPRQDFALADVFGAHYGGVPSAEGGKGEDPSRGRQSLRPGPGSLSRLRAGLRLLPVPLPLPAPDAGAGDAVGGGGAAGGIGQRPDVRPEHVLPADQRWRAAGGASVQQHQLQRQLRQARG